VRVAIGMQLEGALRRLRWAGLALAEEIESRNRRDRTQAAEGRGARPGGEKRR
jgi:hypothetical protein